MRIDCRSSDLATTGIGDARKLILGICLIFGKGDSCYEASSGMREIFGAWNVCHL